MKRACLMILAGGLAAQHSRLPLESDLCSLLFVAAAAMFFFEQLRFAAYLLFGFVAFAAAGQQEVERRLDEKYAGDSILAEVRIRDFPKASGASITMLVEPVADTRLPPRSRITWFEPPQRPEAGDIWAFELRLRRPRGNSNPGTFDLEAWLFREKIHAVGYVVNGRRNRLLARGSSSKVHRFRRMFVGQAEMASSSSEVVAVLAAIGVGSRHRVSREQWDRYAKTGTSHLMAISGLHIGLAAAAAFMAIVAVSGLLRVPGNRLDQAIVGGVALAAAYALVSGFAVPARRALLMLMLIALCFLFRRRADRYAIIAIAATIVFAFDPIAAMAPGYSLSFSAVLVLLWFSHRSSWRLADAGLLARAVRALGELLAMQFALLFGLLPLSVLFFQRIALAAPAVNILVVPIFSIVTVPATLLSMSLGVGSDWLRIAFLRVAAVSIEITEMVTRAISAMPLVDITPPGILGAHRLLLFGVLLWVLLPRGWPGRSVAVLMLLAIILHRPSGPNHACFDTHFLDVGQGLAVVVRTASEVTVFDTGVAFRSGGSAAEQIVLPFLRHEGIAHVDRLIVSHADNDHSGGVAALQANVSIGRTLSGEALPVVGLRASRCRAGQRWRSDGVSFRILHPAAGDRSHGNDASCVLEVGAGRHRLLLTGDIEAPGEAALLRRGALRPVRVAAMPHHGSATSSTPAFVSALQPKLVIASAGHENRWGFPKAAVVSRWQRAGTAVLTTATSGAVSVRMCATGGILSVRENRREHARFWRDSLHD